MNRRGITEHCLTLPSVYEDYPFDDAHSDDGKWAVIRHQANKKSFAHIYERNGKLCINLKCDPIKADILRTVFESVIPG